MKKIVLFILLGALCQQVMFAEREVVLSNARLLPANSLEFLRTHFPGMPVYLVNIERDGDDIFSFGAVLNNGYYIEFDGVGEWREVDCHREQVPVSVIPNIIKKYVDQKYNGEIVTLVDRGLEFSRVRLISRKVLVFDPDSNFVRIDE
ncbi:MAG: PepSY-like domain-containing protein [Prevotellaceae bacterium]|jgi:hypothetical protein|nr:PepSY-like domain-containing protein [Prevotellaceae bacterium]